MGHQNYILHGSSKLDTTWVIKTRYYMGSSKLHTTWVIKTTYYMGSSKLDTTWGHQNYILHGSSKLDTTRVIKTTYYMGSSKLHNNPSKDKIQNNSNHPLHHHNS